MFPFFACLDQSFINKMTEKNPSASLTEPLFELQAKSRLDISYQDGSSLNPYSNEQLYGRGHFSPNMHYTPGATPIDMISDASSVADFPYS